MLLTIYPGGAIAIVCWIGWLFCLLIAFAGGAASLVWWMIGKISSRVKVHMVALPAALGLAAGILAMVLLWIQWTFEGRDASAMEDVGLHQKLYDETLDSIYLIAGGIALSSAVLFLASRRSRVRSDES